jgi:DNA replication protein DnaC
MPQLSEGQLESLFRRLNLAHTRRIYQDLADRAEKENWSYRDFLALLLAEEVAHRKQTRLQRFTRKAHFPFFKTIEEFDFSLQTTLRLSLLGSYLGPDFVTEGRSLIFYGKTGRGKTHLAVAIGYRAIQNGFETLCTNAAELVEELSNASKKGCLQESLLTYTHPHVLVVDEVGYLTYGPDAANVLFHVVNNRHLRKRPMIFTTNKPFSEWGKVLHDEDLAAAILDRILERGRFIHLDGPSWRTRHLNLEEALPAAAERARISGIRVPEFPEPTSFPLWGWLTRSWLPPVSARATTESIPITKAKAVRFRLRDIIPTMSTIEEVRAARMRVQPTTSRCIEDCLSGTISQRQALSPVERLKRGLTFAFARASAVTETESQRILLTSAHAGITRREQLQNV